MSLVKNIGEAAPVAELHALAAEQPAQQYLAQLAYCHHRL